MNDLLSREEFEDQIASLSPDLENLVRNMRSERETKFETISARSAASEEKVTYPTTSDCEGVFSDPSPGNFHDEPFSFYTFYSGPNIHLFADTNIEVRDHIRDQFASFAKVDGFEYTLLDIVNLEKDGGVSKTRPNGLSKGEIRGQESLEGLANLDFGQRDSVNLLFDIATKVWADELSFAKNVIEPSVRYNEKKAKVNRGDVRQKVTELGKNSFADLDKYVVFVSKLAEGIKHDNITNYVADKILASVCVGFNLVESKDKAVVVSNDGDLDLVFNIMYEQILPEYMARSVANTVAGMEDRKVDHHQYFKKCKEHIAWARENFHDDNHVVGFVYNPNKGEFSTHSVAEQFTRFFSNDPIYTRAKSQMVHLMLMNDASPEETYAALTKSNN